MLLGFYALTWLVAPTAPIGSDALHVFITAIGIAGLALAIMAIRELHLQKKIAMQLKKENEGFV